jgi:hypothetical protein
MWYTKLSGAYLAVLNYLGIEPDTVTSAIQSFVRSFVFTLPGMLSAFYLVDKAEVGSASAHDQWVWASHNFWAFLEAQFISPAIRGSAAGFYAHRAANANPPQPPPTEPKT